MKANELMIGDWVYYGDKPVQVLQLSDGKDYPHIKPIPLTAEILEKSGFECRGAWMIPGEDFGLRQDGNSWGVLPYYADYNARALCHIAHLYELQHLLHLCGIELTKESRFRGIELTKKSRFRLWLQKITSLLKQQNS